MDIKRTINAFFFAHTNYRWFQVDHHGSRDVLPSSRFTEKSVERVVSSADSFVAGHLTIRLNSMFQAVEFPTGVANLNAGLSNMNRNALTLWKENGHHINVNHAGLLNDTSRREQSSLKLV